LILSWSFLAAEASAQADGIAAPKALSWSESGASSLAKVALSLDFSDYGGGPVDEWLAAKGFEPKEDAQDRAKLDVDVGGGALVLEAKEQVFGLLVNQGLDVREYSTIRIEWGVTQFPEGASYDAGVNNEAVMVIVFFGHDTLDSGSLFVPDMPYFIGFFLCDSDRTGHPYVGRFHQESGRYICLDRPTLGETIVSELQVATAFRALFSAEEALPISGIAISSDTSSTDGNGTSIAFVKAIQVIE
jgi:hypothetical protein